MNAVVEVQDLSFGFEPDRPCLRDISFRVMEGERVGIIGGNGAGKSTLLWCILGLLKSKGSVRLFGENRTKKSLARVGMVFQNPEDQLFMPAILDDAALPLVNRGVPIAEARSAAAAKLDALELAAMADRPALRLSMGERKRAAIAAALAPEPEILLLDEPTAELDGRSARRLAEILARFDFTRIITTHHLDFLRKAAARTIVLARGGIVADGPTADILGDQVLLQAANLA